METLYLAELTVSVSRRPELGGPLFRNVSREFVRRDYHLSNVVFRTAHFTLPLSARLFLLLGSFAT